MTNISLPTNWDNSLIEKAKKLPVSEVYGKSKMDILGGGRPNYALNNVDKEDIKNYINKTHNLGLKFNYLLNAPCFGNIEFTSDGQKEIMELLEWLEDIGIDKVTATSPYLIQILDKQFSFKIVTSTFCCIDTVQRAKKFEELGADIISIPHYVNRDFEKLKGIKDAVDIETRLIVNLLCVYGCPFLSTHYHANVMGHASTKNQQFGEYPIFNCTKKLISEPEEIIKSRWIRPEDLNKYSEMGFENFKIAGRNRSTEKILEIANAYTQKSYDGNLLDLLDIGWNRSSHLSITKKELPKSFSFLRTAYNIKKAFNSIDLYFDNNSIPSNFLKEFEEKDCKSIDCEKCRYCHKIASNTIEADDVEESMKRLNKIINRYKKMEAL